MARFVFGFFIFFLTSSFLICLWRVRRISSMRDARDGMETLKTALLYRLICCACLYLNLTHRLSSSAVLRSMPSGHSNLKSKQFVWISVIFENEHLLVFKSSYPPSLMLSHHFDGISEIVTHLGAFIVFYNQQVEVF